MADPCQARYRRRRSPRYIFRVTACLHDTCPPGCRMAGRNNRGTGLVCDPLVSYSIWTVDRGQGLRYGTRSIHCSPPCRRKASCRFPRCHSSCAQSPGAADFAALGCSPLPYRGVRAMRVMGQLLESEQQSADIAVIIAVRVLSLLLRPKLSRCPHDAADLFCALCRFAYLGY